MFLFLSLFFLACGVDRNPQVWVDQYFQRGISLESNWVGLQIGAALFNAWCSSLHKPRESKNPEHQKALGCTEAL